jgi:hypothetical protein
MSASCTLQAQTWSEFFKQKKTQIKYLTQQIAALRVYMGYVEKGYRITRDGVDLARDLKNGEFSLHKDYLRSLDGIGRVVSKDNRISAVEQMGSAINRLNGRALRFADKSGALNPGEKRYICKLWWEVLSDVRDYLDELRRVTTPGSYQMTDAERLQRIGRLYQAIQSVYTFARHFSDEMRIYAIQKENGNIEAEAIKRWYHDINGKP